MTSNPAPSREERARRLAYVKEHLRCPHCKQPLSRWEMRPNPFSTWTTDHIYVCVNKDCPYLRGSIEQLLEKGVATGAYCFVYDPSRDWCGPMAARSPPGPKG